MIATRDELIDAALELPEEDRAEIARRLSESLTDDPFESQSLSDEWLAIAERRLAEIRNGTAKTIDHADVMRHIDRQFQDQESRESSA